MTDAAYLGRLAKLGAYGLRAEALASDAAFAAAFAAAAF